MDTVKKRINHIKTKKKEEVLNKSAENVNTEMNLVINHLNMLQSAGTEMKLINDMYDMVGVVDSLGSLLP